MQGNVHLIKCGVIKDKPLTTHKGLIAKLEELQKKSLGARYI